MLNLIRAAHADATCMECANEPIRFIVLNFDNEEEEDDGDEGEFCSVKCAVSWHGPNLTSDNPKIQTAITVTANYLISQKLP